MDARYLPAQGTLATLALCDGSACEKVETFSQCSSTSVVGMGSSSPKRTDLPDRGPSQGLHLVGPLSSVPRMMISFLSVRLMLPT